MNVKHKQFTDNNLLSKCMGWSHVCCFSFKLRRVSCAGAMSRVFLGFVWTDYWRNESNYVITSPANQHDSPAKWLGLRHTVVTGSRYCCYAPVLHWFCVVIDSIVVQDRQTEDYDATLRHWIEPLSSSADQLFLLTAENINPFAQNMHAIIKAARKSWSGPWHLAPCVKLLCETQTFELFTGMSEFYVIRRVEKTLQEAGSWALSPALVASDNSWWRYFFKLSDLIADRGQ